MIDSEGILVHGINGKIVNNGTGLPETAISDMGYFDRLTDNTVLGDSRRDGCAIIEFGIGRWSGANAPFLDVMAYGTEILK